MNSATIYEFDTLVAEGEQSTAVGSGVHVIPAPVWTWLEQSCLESAEIGETRWCRLTQRRGRRAVQVTSYVGVIRAPDGFQIEVLPKVGKAIGGGIGEARRLLLAMLYCLRGFRHIRSGSADLAATRMPLLEVFISEFLSAVEQVVKRGLRHDYSTRRDNLFILRGKLLIGPHLRHNLCRADRFFCEHDEFLPDRAENRLLHTALRHVLGLAASQQNQRLARELCFAFSQVPPSINVPLDFQHVRSDRGMAYYADAMTWARLILAGESPLTGAGLNRATSLLFPMEMVFEAFVAKYLPRQLASPLVLKTQPRQHSLVRHKDQRWFWLKPDLVVRDQGRDRLVLDTKWKLLDTVRANASDKYGLSQGDFYQLQAYGQNHLDSDGDVVLVYPKTDSFSAPLPVFEFPKAANLRLWVLPFCLDSRTLLVPPSAPFADIF